MKREDKKSVVDNLHTAWLASSAGVVTHYRGLTVAEMGELRRMLTQSGIRLQVVKNTLARRAAEGTDFAVAEDLFSGPTAVAFGADPVAMSKALSDFAKQHHALQILGGVLEGKRIGAEDIKALASLPSREVLLARLLGSMVAPISGFVRTLSEVPASLVRTLAAVRDQRQAA